MVTAQEMVLLQVVDAEVRLLEGGARTGGSVAA